jgi:diadenosine tetraphosphatase ApaH/serine/threonine PP2A family protein phosphatase
MIVRDAGADWQIVLQPDHADLSGQLARAWAEKGERFASVEIAARRHDDGWAVWERMPGLDPGSDRPRNFLDVQVLSHLAFYRAAIAAVSDHDPYAGLLVSMHGAGIYRQRYGRDPGLRLTFAGEVEEQVDAFVAEQEAGYPDRAAEVGVGEERRWADYGLLQVFDRLSLFFCMRDVENGEAAELDGLRLEPLAPWRMRLEPYPFTGRSTRFVLLRRVLPKRGWSEDEFREEFFGADPQRTEIVIEP